MIQRNNNKCTPSSHFWRQSLLLPSLTCLGVVSLFSHEPAFGQTEKIDTLVVPTKEDTSPSVTTPAVKTMNNSSASTARIERLRQKLAVPTTPAKQATQQNIATPPPPTRSVSQSRSRVEPVVSSTKPSPRKTATHPPLEAGSAYIDSTNYSVGATRGYEPPSAVVLSERATGCTAVLRSGQGVSRNACGKTPNRTRIAVNTPQSRRSLTQVPDWAKKERMTNVASVAPIGSNVKSVATSYGASKKPPAYIQSAIALANKSLNSSTLAYSNRTSGSESRLMRTGLLFPLALPAPITSLFGWRIHPISGDRRMHTGTDLGAPLGTPVLAAHQGKVAIANFLGGYGLTVVLEHNPFTKSNPEIPLTSTPPQQTLYGHLSEIFVQPGETVAQGTVIGRVGSTGNSTGPHLHFETRHLTPDGWVATDPGIQLEYALTQLVEALKTARSPQDRG